MSQENYVKTVLKKFNMEECKPVSTPMNASEKLLKVELSREEYQEMKNVPYSQAVGSLMYLAVSTRPDIAYAVSCLSQFNNCPAKCHWSAVKHVMRYLKKTQHFSLKFFKTGQDLHGYVDSDWGGNVIDRRSYTGYVFLLGGAPISWEARKQKSVALSSTEAEYMAMCEASKEAVYLKRFFKDINFEKSCQNTVVLYCDNQGAQKLVKNPVYHSRTKHIDIRHHYVREIYEKKEIDIKYIPTNDMVADIFTKPLFKMKHELHITKLGIDNSC